MKKYLIGGVLVAAVIAYSVFLNSDNGQPMMNGGDALATGTNPATGTSTASVPGSSTPPGGKGPGSSGGEMPNPANIVIGDTVYTNVMLNVRQGASTSTALIRTESSGASGVVTKTTLTPLGTTWLNIAYSDGTTGWSDADYISTMSPTASGGSQGQYNDGTYTGTVADAFYGKLQVTVTISGGNITGVTFPQYPQGGHSSDVSEMALPVLAQEAVTAQSANVDIVSGATQDSQAFQQSLASALSQAKS